MSLALFGNNCNIATWNVVNGLLRYWAQMYLAVEVATKRYPLFSGLTLEIMSLTAF